MLVLALLLGLAMTSYWAMRVSPWTQVGTRNAVRFDAGVFTGDPVPELGFEPLLAPGAAGLVVVGLQRVVVLRRENHGVELPSLSDEHRFTLGLRRQAAESILGFSGRDAHGGPLKRLAILANKSLPRQHHHAELKQNRRLRAPASWN